MKPTVVILAAGLGTRMKSGLAKALHPLAGRPLVQYVLDAAAGVGPEKILLVLGHQADKRLSW
jgi:bifunctional N-acetylglucosamine-1-phosphate-uridyltransferase/glucosamine-1-phosphate-acetyltransferase GlmU-like protein